MDDLVVAVEDDDNNDIVMDTLCNFTFIVRLVV